MAASDPQRNGDPFLGTSRNRRADSRNERRGNDPSQARTLSPLLEGASGSQSFSFRRSHAYRHAPRPPSHLPRRLSLSSPASRVSRTIHHLPIPPTNSLF